VSYNFLWLSLLLAVPGAVVFLARPDLRRVMGLGVLCALPFAFTEFLFYPAYWEPRFLFDMGRRLGFGLEDFIFVAGLGAFTSTAYAFLTGSRYQGPPTSFKAALRRSLRILLPTFALVALVALVGIPMIYGAIAIMLLFSAGVCALRKDLTLPALTGALLVMVVYGVLCLFYGRLFPGVFKLTWHTEKFLNLFLLGVPLEELLYGFAAGAAATVFYPYITHQRLVRSPI
jgi:hypothetical protein